MADALVLNNQYFQDLKAKAAKKAMDIVEKEATKSLYILKNRLGMSETQSAGRFPKDEKRTEGQHAFQQWTAKVDRANGLVVLSNNATGSQGFNYPMLLMFGDHRPTYFWGTSKKGIPMPLPTKRITKEGFSTQMPLGIQPFLDYRMEKLGKRLAEGLVEEMTK